MAKRRDKRAREYSRARPPRDSPPFPRSPTHSFHLSLQRSRQTVEKDRAEQGKSINDEAMCTAVGEGVSTQHKHGGPVASHGSPPFNSAARRGQRLSRAPRAVVCRSPPAFHLRSWLPSSQKAAARRAAKRRVCYDTACHLTLMCAHALAREAWALALRGWLSRVGASGDRTRRGAERGEGSAFPGVVSSACVLAMV